MQLNLSFQSFTSSNIHKCIYLLWSLSGGKPVLIISESLLNGSCCQRWLFFPPTGNLDLDKKKRNLEEKLKAIKLWLHRAQMKTDHNSACIQQSQGSPFLFPDNSFCCLLHCCQSTPTQARRHSAWGLRCLRGTGCRG